MLGHRQHDAMSGLVATLREIRPSQRGVDRILNAIRTHLSMDVAFVAEFRAADRVFRHVDATALSPIQCGDTVPLEQGFCQRVIDGRLPQLIKDAHALPAAAALPETAAIPIGSHLSVPIYLRDGRVYGTFCCFSYLPDTSLTDRDLQIMRAFADLVADQIEEDLQQTRARTERVRCITEMMRLGQPAMVYQPIYELDSQQIAGVEALSRFQTTPQHPPDVWFAEAAAVGLGPALEGCAATRALEALSSLPPEAYVAVNASPELILSGSLQQVLQSVDISRVVLEVTEHASVSDYDRLLEALTPLRVLGLRISIDDTGAGYASMRHILNIEPDLVKLDISLTRGIDQDRKRRALASALIAFAGETGIDIIAEGVETAAELDTLQRLGVNYAQGYFLSRPVPLGDVPRSGALPPPVAQRGADLRLR